MGILKEIHEKLTTQKLLTEVGGGVSGKTRSVIAALHDDDKFQSKPVSWDDFGRDDSVSVEELTTKYGLDLRSLKVFNVDEAFGKPSAKPHDYFEQALPQAFVLFVPGKGYFLVDTSGFDYVRYATRLTGMK